MPVELIEGNYINYLFVAGGHEVSWLVRTIFKVYTVHNIIALLANTLHLYIQMYTRRTV